MRFTGLRTVLFAGAAASAITTAANAAEATAAAAPEADARGGPAIEELIVTARRREENVQKTPVAVTVLSQDKLDRLTVNNNADLNKLAPGLQLGGCIGRNNCGPTIRAQPTGTNTGTTSVVQYFAEVPNFQISFYDLENLQVLKGPQGTLFGETATGGAILYTPRKPTNEFGGYASVQLGSYDYRQFDAAVGGPLVKDTLLARAAIRYRKRDGFTTAIYSNGAPPNDIDNVDNLQWRLSLVWRPTDKFESYTIYAGSRDRTRGSSEILRYVDPTYVRAAQRNVIPAANPATAAAFEFYTGVAPPAGMTYGQLIQAQVARQNAVGVRTVFANYDQSVAVDFNGLVNQTRWDIRDDLSFKNIIGLYWTKAGAGGSNYDGVDLPTFESRGVLQPGTTTPNGDNWAQLGGWPSRVWTEEAQLSGKAFDQRLIWQVGGYYRKAKDRDFLTASGNVLFAAFSGDPTAASFCTDTVKIPAPCSRVRRSDATTYAGYGQATFAITDNLRLTGGYRHSWDKVIAYDSGVPATQVVFKGSTFTLQTVGKQPPAGAGVLTTLSPLTQQDTYSITADWQVTDRVLLYATHRTGYTRGGINSTAPLQDPNRAFGPERVKDFEVGLKADWALGGIKGRTNIAVYRDKYSDIQRNDVIPGSSFTVVRNAADAILQGVEFESAVALNDWFDVQANLSYIDAYYTRWSETSTCAGQPYHSQCATLPATTPIVIDHAQGVITGLGAPIRFDPERFRGASKWTWSIQPTLRLEPWTGEDISIGANIRYRGAFATFSTNSSLTAGNPPGTFTNVLPGSDPFVTPAYTLVDLRVAWNRIKGSDFSVAASVTNLTDKAYNLGGTNILTSAGSLAGVVGEPRMWFLEVRREF